MAAPFVRHVGDILTVNQDTNMWFVVLSKEVSIFMKSEPFFHLLHNSIVNMCRVIVETHSH